MWPEEGPKRAALVALSGGADSVSLAYLARSAVPDFLERVGVAHFHHHLRGREADADERFAGECARSLGFEYHQGDWSPDSARGLPRPDRNLQAAARRARYDFLVAAAKQHGYGVVLTAHHQRDQVETILQNLARGGRSGAWNGIRQGMTRGGIWVLRPLLSFSPECLRDYLVSLGVGFREDSSNLNLKYRRNWVRHKLLAPIRRAFPVFEVQVCERSQRFACQEQLWSDWAAEIVAQGLVRDRELLLSRERLARVPQDGRFAVVREVLRALDPGTTSEGWAPTRAKPFREFFRFLDAPNRKGEVNLPGGIRARFEGKVLALHKREGSRT